MMNYKSILKPSMEVVPGTGGKYITHMHDILETKTNQIIATIPGHNDEAKKLCRHLNMGGFFDGFTPAFFLQSISRSLSGDSLEND